MIDPTVSFKIGSAADKQAARKLRKRMADRNRRFMKLPPQKQRVRIAKDVIEQLDAGDIKAAFLTGYFIPSGLTRYSNKWEGAFDTGEPIQIGQIAETERCTVCAVGGVFAAAVRRADNLSTVTMSHSNDENVIKQYLSQWFEREQLVLIESAFEGQGVYFSGRDNVQLGRRQRAYDFRRAVISEYNGQHAPGSAGEPVASFIMRKIMENIIDNGGEFRP